MMRATMDSWTWPAFPSLRFRFELLLDARWRSPGLRRMILPVAVILTRLAADFFVLRRAIDFGMGARKVAGARRAASPFSALLSAGHSRGRVCKPISNSWRICAHAAVS